MELGEAVSSYRVFQSELSQNRFYEYFKKPIPEKIVQCLKEKGHIFRSHNNYGKSVVQAIQRWENGTISAASDTRKNAEADGY